MHLSDCPICGRRELRGDRSIRSLRTAHGPVLTTTCRGCGAALSVATNRVLRRATTADVA